MTFDLQMRAFSFIWSKSYSNTPRSHRVFAAQEVMKNEILKIDYPKT